jgi:glyoxylase-like metal-dependent hydrolase (beta-lactamase superfamily II)
MVAEYAEKKGLQIEYIFCTHGHFDHTDGAEELGRKYGKAVLLYGDTDPVTSTKIEDGAELPLGDLTARIIHTPGHTQDSMCVLVGDALFTGDTLFVGKVGGTGFGQDARDEYDALHDKLMVLPDATRVFPGHNYGVAPESTIKHEKETNPFLLRPDLDSFVDLKKNWAAYKREHGIA